MQTSNVPTVSSIHHLVCIQSFSACCSFRRMHYQTYLLIKCTKIYGPSFSYMVVECPWQSACTHLNTLSNSLTVCLVPPKRTTGSSFEVPCCKASFLCGHQAYRKQLQCHLACFPPTDQALSQICLDGSARDRRESLELQQPWAGDGNPTHTSQTSKRDSQDHSLQENTRKQVTWGSFPPGTWQQPPKHLSRRPCWI